MKTLFILLVCNWVVYISKAQPLIGLDPSFANNGIYTGDTGVYGHIGVQSDGKILVTGREKRNGVYENVKRLNNDGTVDLSFANGGFFTMLFYDGKIGGLNSIYFQPDGKIILGGGVDKNLLITRLQSNGNLDSSFGNNGNVITSLTGEEYITSITLQMDGKIVVCGDKYNDNAILVARYHINGLLDSSFGINGIISSDWNMWGINYARVNDIAVMKDGKIVVGTKATIDALGGASAFTAIRLLPNGELDTSFNHTGIAYTNYSLGSLLYCKSMRLQSDGKVLLSGYGDSICVVRFDTLGQLDNSFGSGGILKVDQGDGRAMELQPDGKIVVAGIANAGVPNNPGVVLYRRLSDGSPDNSFGINGKISSDDFNVFNGVVLQNDGKILVCGNTIKITNASYPLTALARFTPNATYNKEYLLTKKINIYPNPATNEILIENNTQRLIEQLCLYSTDGKLVLTQLHPATNRLSTENLANGIYYLKIHFSNSAFTQKIVIQKN